MKNLIFLLLILGIVMIAPNVLWLIHSTARVTNESNGLLRDIALRVGSQSVPVGDVASQASRFAFLPSDFGGATLSVEYKSNNAPASQCQVYVESTKYHVEIVVDENHNTRCTVELVTLMSLFVWKLL